MPHRNVLSMFCRMIAAAACLQMFCSHGIAQTALTPPGPPAQTASTIQRVQQEIETLTALRDKNVAMLAKQQETLKKLEELEATSRQIRLFAR